MDSGGVDTPTEENWACLGKRPDGSKARHKVPNAGLSLPPSGQALPLSTHPAQLQPLHRGPVEIGERLAKADKTDAFRSRRRGDTAGSDNPHHY